MAGAGDEMFFISSVRKLTKSWTQALTHMSDDRQQAEHVLLGGSWQRQWLSDHGGVLITSEPWQPAPAVVWGVRCS